MVWRVGAAGVQLKPPENRRHSLFFSILYFSQAQYHIYPISSASHSPSADGVGPNEFLDRGSFLKSPLILLRVLDVATCVDRPKVNATVVRRDVRAVDERQFVA